MTLTTRGASRCQQWWVYMTNPSMAAATHRITKAANDALLSSAEGPGLLSGLSCSAARSGVVWFSYLPDGRGISLRLALGGVWGER